MNKNIEKACRTLVEKILEHPDIFVKKAQQGVSGIQIFLQENLQIHVCLTVELLPAW